jgi:hypothetical protein
MRGGGSTRACHAAEGEREKEGPAQGRQSGHGARMAPGSMVGVGSVRSQRRRAGEQGRARATRRGLADRRGRTAMGPGVSGGMQEGGVSGALWWRGADRRARPAQCQAAQFKLGFKLIQNIQTVQIKFEFL